VLAEYAECLLQQAHHDRVDLAEAHAAGRHRRETERRPHEPVGYRGDSRDAGGRSEALASRFAPARSGLRVAKRERQLAALGVVGGLEPPQRFKGAAVVNGRLFGGEQRGGALRHPSRVVDGLRDVPAGQALEEVVRELCEVCLGPRAVQPLERLRDAAMELHPPRSGELRAQRFVDEAVGEAVTAGGARHLRDRARPAPRRARPAAGRRAGLPPAPAWPARTRARSPMPRPARAWSPPTRGPGDGLRPRARHAGS